MLLFFKKLFVWIKRVKTKSKLTSKMGVTTLGNCEIMSEMLSAIQAQGCWTVSRTEFLKMFRQNFFPLKEKTEKLDLLI